MKVTKIIRKALSEGSANWSLKKVGKVVWCGSVVSVYQVVSKENCHARQNINQFLSEDEYFFFYTTVQLILPSKFTNEMGNICPYFLWLKQYNMPVILWITIVAKCISTIKKK